MDPKLLEMAKYIWRSPGELASGASNTWEGNAVVLWAPTARPNLVIVADLDSGRRYTVAVEDLVERVRPIDADTYGYSYTCDAHEDFVALSEDR